MPWNFCWQNGLQPSDSLQWSFVLKTALTICMWFIDLQHITLQNILLDTASYVTSAFPNLEFFVGRRQELLLELYGPPQVIITICFTCDSCIFCWAVLHLYWCYCEFFVLYKVIIIIIFIEILEVWDQLIFYFFLFCANVFVGCSEGEVQTWSRLVVAWQSYVYDDGGRHAFWLPTDCLFWWSSSKICTISSVHEQECCFQTAWGEYK